MKKSSAQNSAIFLATLGVYLGLVLTGGAQQTFAHAALTRQFDVREEIEIADDLDKTPDDERSPVTSSVQIYIEDLERFLSNLSRLRSGGKFDTEKDTFSVGASTLLPCVDSNRAGRYTPVRFELTREAFRPAIDSFSRGMVYGYSLGDCVANNEFGGASGVASRYNFGFDGTAFTVTVSVRKDSPQAAAELIRQIESVLKLYSRTDSELRRSIIEMTRLRAQNDQVFVVTRLPRGSLISLLS